MPDEAVELAPKLWQIAVPLPVFPGAEHLGATNTYVVGGERFALVDTGLTTEEAVAALEYGLGSAGLSWRDIELIFITHHHPDHYGLSDRVRELTGGRVLLHRRDIEVMFRGMWGNVGWDRFFSTHGGPAVDLDGPLFSNVPGFHPAAPDGFIDEGEEIDLGGRVLRVMHTPGHAPGHCCFAIDAEETVMTGDHLLPKTTPHVGYFPGGDPDPLRSFLASLRRFEESNFRLALPAHERIFSEPAARATRIVRHHMFRLKACVDALGTGEKTAWEIIPDVFGDLPDIHRFAALFETLSHLVYAESEGLAVREEHDGKTLWRSVR
jgi:glyoxylase-like metal-dependent hydrolase (beta-lactamase superfamily II)